MEKEIELTDEERIEIEIMKMKFDLFQKLSDETSFVTGEKEWDDMFLIEKIFGEEYAYNLQLKNDLELNDTSEKR